MLFSIYMVYTGKGRADEDLRENNNNNNNN